MLLLLVITGWQAWAYALTKQPQCLDSQACQAVQNTQWCLGAEPEPWGPLWDPQELLSLTHQAVPIKSIWSSTPDSPSLCLNDTQQNQKAVRCSLVQTSNQVLQLVSEAGAHSLGALLLLTHRNVDSQLLHQALLAGMQQLNQICNRDDNA